MAGPIDRSFGSQAFGLDPAGYHSARPEYPDWIFERVGPLLGRNVFEIGAGTGLATKRLLEFDIDALVAIEPDPRLSRYLSEGNVDSRLQVIESSFETFQAEANSFDLGICATAFHWLDEKSTLEKVASLIKSSGWWVMVWNVFGDDVRSDPFHDATQHLMKGITSPSAGTRGIPFALDVDARVLALEDSGSFDEIDHEIRHWELVLNADQVVNLYRTFSDTVVRDDLDTFLPELHRVAKEEFGDRVIRNMSTSYYAVRVI